MAAARPPYDFMKAYGRRNFADQLLDMSTLTAKFVQSFRPYGCCKVDTR